MRATYRLQLTPEFGFDAVIALLPYFERLGISHLYLSPITEARRGSTHGYDVIDHNRVREAFGGREGFEKLREAALARGLELLLDFVPNHAGVGPRNRAWQDVLAYGPHSRYAAMFDIDWQPIKRELEGKILLPFLGRPYGEALDDGELTISFEDGRFYARYFENRFALAPRTYAPLLEGLLPALERQEAYFDLKELLEAYKALEPAERDKAEALAERLAAFADKLPFAEGLAELESAEKHALFEQQYWRLAYWKTAGYEINYRRFFDINELVALRMEDEETFWAAHKLLGELVREDGVAGVRIDHIDGLFDPQAYLDNLKALGVKGAWVEKILAPGETLPEAWWTKGTTGYEFLNDAMGVLLDPEGVRQLERLYRRDVRNVRFEDEVHAAKRLVMETSLSGELFRLATELNRLSEADYHTRDVTLEALREALAEIIAALHRYRTYLPYEPGEAKAVLGEAVAQAKRRNVAQEPSVFDFILQVLTGELPESQRQAQRAFIGRFQQYTAPVAAKGVEDTAFYRYLPLVALNEVGGEPGELGTSVQAFHAHARFRAYRYPENLLATATHDHKRGEDTRARLLALAEEHALWQETFFGLEALWERLKPELIPLPFGETLEKQDRYLCYQLMAALWVGETPESLQTRLQAYTQKAVREAKLRSSWLNPDERYEALLSDFVAAMIGSEEARALIAPLAERLSKRGFDKSLAQLTLKLTTPGVPDFYQGCELLDLSLVDPDNRRPVDFKARQRALGELEPLLAAPEVEPLRAMREAQDPKLKLYVTARLLRLRKEHPALFAGSYQALETPDGLIAFTREGDEGSLLVVVARSSECEALRLAAPKGRWREVLSGVEGELPEAPLEVLPLGVGVFFQPGDLTQG